MNGGDNWKINGIRLTASTVYVFSALINFIGAIKHINPWYKV